MTRATSFSYVCGRCSRCCYSKGITLNPYEVLRLARNQGQTTTAFFALHTDNAGARLRQRPDGSCVFLTGAGCSVHADRPLVCRIYPLGRHISPEDEETFSELEPHAETAGRYGTQGTVGDYLESQGAEPFMRAADRYLNLFRELADSLVERVVQLAAPERQAVAQKFARAAGQCAPKSTWLDVDLVVDEYCRERGLAKPDEAAQLMELHAQALRAYSSNFTEEKAP
jgi:Fe-S-cluster containining protein